MADSAPQPTKSAAAPLKKATAKTTATATAAPMKKPSATSAMKKAKSDLRGRSTGMTQWREAVADARVELKITGFCAVGGKSEQGQALLQLARKLHLQKKEAATAEA